MSQQAEVTGSGRGTLLLIVGIPLAMILGASLLWYLVARATWTWWLLWAPPITVIW